MIKKWTHEQEEAISAGKGNLLIAAGAGAGKTAVLVERIVHKIVDEKSPVDIDRLLVVTFTNAAAAEMKERIGDELQRIIEEDSQSFRFQKQLILLNQANIMTMHSFCLQVIRNNFHVLDIDPNFRVSDNEENILLKRDAVEELFEEKYNSEDVDFLTLIDSYGDRNDVKVEDMVLSLYDFIQSLPWPYKWLEKSCENFNLESNFYFKDSIWSHIIMENFKNHVKSLVFRLNKANDIIYDGSGVEAYGDILMEDICKLKSFMAINDWDELNIHISSFKFSKLPSVKKNKCDIEIKDKVYNIRKNVKDEFKNMLEKNFGDSEDISNGIKEMYPLMRCLSSLVIDFGSIYSSKKKDRNIVDFNDIEHLCLKILTCRDEMGNICPSDDAMYYRKFFSEILIDEYQDSNAVQEVIIDMISRKGEESNTFMVGDVKQSIYRFRQAKPELFLKKYKSYSDSKGKENRRIKLFKNFRSRHEVIDAVNYLFSQIMCVKVGELDYDESEEILSSAEYPEGNEVTFSGAKVELHLIDSHYEEINAGDKYDELDENTDNIQVEARLIASRINELINPKKGSKFKIYDKNLNEYRTIMYRDIVILMRATRNWAPVIAKELGDLNIPVFADTSTGYFETLEIQTIMSLLQIIDNPIQDIPLISVLRSPIGSFSPEELIDIRLVNRNIPLYEALKCYCSKADFSIECRLDHVTEELKSKVIKFLTRLDIWRRKVSYLSMDEFLWYLYTETGYYGFAGAMPGGSQRQANLRMLFEKAKQYENSSYNGLFNFINFINKLRNSSGDMGSAKILGENEDVVRIMSIHKSKGLEFPVVILAGTGKNFNFTDMKKPVLFDEELGFGPDYVNIKRRIRYPTIIKQILKDKIKAETLSEEMRILYVAFTRAREKLIITGMVNNLEKCAEKWCDAAVIKEDKIPEHCLLSAKSYLDWIGEAVVRHVDGKSIRDICGCQVKEKSELKNKSRWQVNFWKRQDFFRKKEEHEKIDIVKEIRNCSNNEKSEYYAEINRRLHWKYKYSELSHIPAKFSVSELKRRFKIIDTENSVDFLENVASEGENLRKPQFIKEASKISGAEKGTLMHTVMQHVDLKKTDSLSDIKEQIEKLVFKEFITEKESKVVSPYKILKFFNSDIGRRMKKSLNVRREVPFYIEMNIRDLYPQLSEEFYKNEKILVQGIIDCYFEDDHDIVLIDYKTDYVENIDDMREKYEIQIYYYSRALERMTGMRVKERYLYLFHNSMALKL